MIRNNISGFFSSPRSFFIIFQKTIPEDWPNFGGNFGISHNAEDSRNIGKQWAALPDCQKSTCINLICIFFRWSKYVGDVATSQLGTDRMRESTPASLEVSCTSFAYGGSRGNFVRFSKILQDSWGFFWRFHNNMRVVSNVWKLFGIWGTLKDFGRIFEGNFQDFWRISLDFWRIFGIFEGFCAIENRFLGGFLKDLWDFWSILWFSKEISGSLALENQFLKDFSDFQRILCNWKLIFGRIFWIFEGSRFLAPNNRFWRIFKGNFRIFGT